MSYLTDAEITALQESGLQQKEPFAIYGVSQSQFSIARHYGGASYNGAHYTYFPEDDELIRDDVLRWITKHRKKHPPNHSQIALI